MEKISAVTRAEIFALRPSIAGFLIIDTSVRIYMESNSDIFVRKCDPSQFAETVMQILSKDTPVTSYMYFFDQDLDAHTDSTTITETITKEEAYTKGPAPPLQRSGSQGSKTLIKRLSLKKIASKIFRR